MINYDLDLNLIPEGSLIRDIEDGDCFFEGIWIGQGMYKVTRVVWNGEESLTKEEDDEVETIRSLAWYWIEVFDQNGNKILNT